MTNLITVPFQGDVLSYFVRDGKQYLPVRQFCDILGLDWRGQLRKLTRGDRPWGVVRMTTPSAGGDQETVCLPLQKLPAWLFSISPSKVKPELQAKLIAYQEECDEVLYSHFIQGDAAHPGVMRRIEELEHYFHHARLELLIRWQRMSTLDRMFNQGRYSLRHIHAAMGIGMAQFEALVSQARNIGVIPLYVWDWDGGQAQVEAGHAK